MIWQNATCTSAFWNENKGCITDATSSATGMTDQFAITALYAICQIPCQITIPGQGSRVQVDLWTVPLATGQAAPPFIAACVTIYCLVWTPVPHVTLHGPNDVQAPTQSTGPAKTVQKYIQNGE
jgi:hypothetical protein